MQRGMATNTDDDNIEIIGGDSTGRPTRTPTASR